MRQYYLHTHRSSLSEGQEEKRFGTPQLVFILPLFGHLQLSTELPGQPLQLGLEWYRGVDGADLKSFEKQLNLPVACYSNVAKWYVDFSFFFFLD